MPYKCEIDRPPSKEVVCVGKERLFEEATRSYCGLQWRYAYSREFQKRFYDSSRFDVSLYPWWLKVDLVVDLSLVNGRLCCLGVVPLK